MKKLALTLSTIGIALFLTGCSTTTSTPVQYKALTKNVINIEESTSQHNVKVKTLAFTAAPSVNDSPWCRAMGAVSLGSKTPAQFIHDAFQEELFLAKAYSNSAEISISGRVEKLEFSSIAPAHWTIGLSLSSSNGYKYDVENKYVFKTSWDAIGACKNVADAFTPAVQSILEKAVSDARFQRLIAK